MADLWWNEATATAEDVDIKYLLDSSSDDSQPSWGGSKPGKAPNINGRSDEVAQRLHMQYFANSPIYDDAAFQRRYRTSRQVFQRIFDKITEHDPFSQQRRDCTGRMGLHPYLKITAAFRILAYGIAADAIDETFAMSETTALLFLEHVQSVIACFSGEYMRAPTEADTKNILLHSAKRGFPGMLGSIDCCKWHWKNCPTAWHGQYEEKEGVPVVTLEAICDHSLWIWHAFFGFRGSGNDINVVDASTLKGKISNGTYPPPLEYVINGVRRNKPYWLADGIYPKWPVFVQTVAFLANQKDECLAKHQEACRKDVERAFGVLQSKWHTVARPARFWAKETMKDVMQCCIILHNMIVEDRGGLAVEADAAADDVTLRISNGAEPMWGGLKRILGRTPPPVGSLAAICETQVYLKDSTEYFETPKLVMEHLWHRQGTIQTPLR